MSERLSFAQTEDENRKEFIARLVQAGWKRRDAVQEWERIQGEDDE